MKKKRLGLLLSLLVGIALVWAAMSTMAVIPAVAGPAPAPTPISVPAGGGDWVMANFLVSQLMTDSSTSYNGITHQLAAYNVADIQSTTDVTLTGQMTATCYLQFSNDGTNFDQLGFLLFDTRDADATLITQTNLFGRYGRITCTTAYTGTTGGQITVSLVGKLHN